jgi:hypothetical protein
LRPTSGSKLFGQPGVSASFHHVRWKTLYFVSVVVMFLRFHYPSSEAVDKQVLVICLIYEPLKLSCLLL